VRWSCAFSEGTSGDFFLLHSTQYDEQENKMYRVILFWEALCSALKSDEFCVKFPNRHGTLRLCQPPELPPAAVGLITGVCVYRSYDVNVDGCQRAARKCSSSISWLLHIVADHPHAHRTLPDLPQHARPPTVPLSMMHAVTLAGSPARTATAAQRRRKTAPQLTCCAKLWENTTYRNALILFWSDDAEFLSFIGL